MRARGRWMRGRGRGCFRRLSVGGMRRGGSVYWNGIGMGCVDGAVYFNVHDFWVDSMV
jgi:hypothetical protein